MDKANAYEKVNSILLPLPLLFFSPRDLRCLRNTIHVNLFITYILSASVWFILLAYQVSQGKGHRLAGTDLLAVE